MLDVLCALPPAAGLRVAARLGRLAPPGRRVVGQLNALFETAGAPSAPLAGIAREIRARRWMAAALLTYAGRVDPRALLRCVDEAAPAALAPIRNRTGPIVLITWHVGPPFGLTLAFAASSIRAMGIQRRNYGWPAMTTEFNFVEEGRDARPAVLWRATKYLRGGGVVAMAIDALTGTRVAPVPCLGRAIRFARGPFVLSRLTGAILVPAVARWARDGLVGVEVGEPIGRAGENGMPEGDDERALAARAGSWFETYARSAPEELRVTMLRRLLEAPPLPASDAP